MLTRAGLVTTAIAATMSSGLLLAQTPAPFPGSRPPSTAPGSGTPEKPAAPSTPAAPPRQNQPAAAPAAKPAEPAPNVGAHDPALAGVPIFPSADFLDSFDAGKGQRYYVFGTSAPFLEVVAYYRTQLKNGGRELFKAPAMQQFDLGKYAEETMVYPPSIVVKDYTWNNSTGYLHVTGAQERRYPTIIQIVPR